MSLWSVGQWLELAASATVAVVAAVDWIRRRRKSAARLAQAFGLLAGFVLFRRLLPTPPTGPVEVAVAKVVLVLFVLFPYRLFRFARAFTPASRRSDRSAKVSTAAVAVATVCLPDLAGRSGELAWWAVAYRVLFVAAWTLLSVLTVSRLLAAGRRQPSVIRRRMCTLGAASAAMHTAVLLAGISPAADGAPLIARRGIGLTATLLFVVGFAPPGVLRGIWRRREVEAFHRAEAELMAADSSERITGIVLPHATELVGAQSAVLFDGNGAVLAQHRMDAQQARAVAARLATEAKPGNQTLRTDGLAAIRLRDGWLAMTTSESAPLLGADEFGLLESLAHFAGLALERAELAERERAGREALIDREAQLAEAQRTAHIGSYSWDLVTDDVWWSDEMYRVLGFTPGDPDARRSFIDRVHPDDRDRVWAAKAAIRNLSTPSMSEWRVVLLDGEIRWMQGRVRPTCENGVAVSVCGTVQDITDRKVAEELISFQANHDVLTHLPSRVIFVERLSAAFERARGGGDIAVILLDVDRFKWLNDSLGHPAGDALLIEFADRLRSVVRPEDTVARFGGDEFAVLCEGMDANNAESLAGRIASALGAPVVIGGEDTTMTVSIGVAVASAHHPVLTPGALVRDADTAMYRAKEVGRNRIEVFDVSTRLMAVARHETANDLRRGIERGELVVHFQPEIDITTGIPVGVEALVRWAHPQRGLVPPLEFIAVAEETGLIVPLGAAVLREACTVMAGWHRADDTRAGMTVAVNLSTRQLLAPNLGDVVRDALESSGLAPERLCVEITESVLLEDSDASARVLEGLKAFGILIGVDDFGTGFSSLTYLKRFPVDVLKIDRSFVDGLGRSREDRAIVSSIVDLAHAFGLTTIAEGIETPEQLAELRALGCEQGQGYLWSRPMPVDVADEWMTAQAMARTVREPESRRSCSRTRSRSRSTHRVLLVDDDRSMRRLLKMVLEGEDQFDVVGETDDGRDAIALARHHRPDLVLLDLAMPGMGGLEALPLLLAVAPDAKVVVFSGLDSLGLEDAARRRGASAFLTKGIDPTDLCRRLEPLMGPPTASLN
ncbi:MAG TPA: EAL domain-containing protein [Acidimicrobiales bacterium]|nr:EAL domain-containing protein [Acidimicrobiales bacterium]